MESPWLLSIFIIPATCSLCFSPTLFPSLCFTSCRSLFVYFSLCDKLASPDVSNFPFSPPFCFSLAVVSSFLLYSYIPVLFPLTLPSLPPPLCLCTLSGLLPSSPATPPCFLLCVCCLFRLTLLHSEGINPYTCQCVVEAARQSLFRPSGGTANLHIHKCAQPHISHVTGSTSLKYFIVCLILCFYSVCEQMN